MAKYYNNGLLFFISMAKVNLGSCNYFQSADSCPNWPFIVLISSSLVAKSLGTRTFSDSLGDFGLLMSIASLHTQHFGQLFILR